MTIEPDNLELEPPRSQRPRGTVVAWFIILLVTFSIIVMQMAQPGMQTGEGKLEKILFGFQFRYIVGAASLLGDETKETLRGFLQTSESAPDWQKLRQGVVAGELSGPEAALKRLRAIRESTDQQDPGAEEGSSLSLLIQTYRDYTQEKFSAPSLSQQQRNTLRNELGWFGKLALAPPGTEGPLREEVLSAARHAFFAVIAGVLAIGATGLLGLFVLIIFLALLFRDGLPDFRQSAGHGGIYAETVACWLLLFLGLNLVGGAWFGPESAASVGLLALMGSFLAVAWPLLRGVPWPQLRADLGWNVGRGWLREIPAGIGCYAMAILLVIVGMLLMSVLIKLLAGGIEAGGAPVHPVARWLVDGTWWQRAQLMLLACIVAPLLEETIFRGFFYRHLREATGTMSRPGSVVVSALVTSAFFAVLHPQGLLAAPGIIGIGLAFAFMREWRGSLLAPMIAHALNNTVIMVLLTAIFSS